MKGGEDRLRTETSPWRYVVGCFHEYACGKRKGVEGISERKRDIPITIPLYTFTFLPNDFLPDVRINYDGIVDIKGKKTLWNRRNLVHHTDGLPPALGNNA